MAGVPPRTQHPPVNLDVDVGARRPDKPARPVNISRGRISLPRYRVGEFQEPVAVDLVEHKRTGIAAVGGAQPHRVRGGGQLRADRLVDAVVEKHRIQVWPIDLVVVGEGQGPRVTIGVGVRQRMREHLEAAPVAHPGRRDVRGRKGLQTRSHTRIVG